MIRVGTTLSMLLAAILLSSEASAQFDRETAERLRPEIDDRIRALVELRQQHADKYWAAARAIDDAPGAGSAYNNIDIRKHRCFVISQYLGFSELTKGLNNLHLQILDEKSRNDLDRAHYMRISSISASNFAHNAELLLAEPLDRMALEWNIDCTTELGSSTPFVAWEDIPTFYTVENDGKTLHVFGKIERGYADRLARAINANPSVTAIAIGSPGGNVIEAVKAGEFIRKKGLRTTAWSSCHSACPLVFLGGVERIIYQPYPDFGFHQIYGADGRAIPLDDPGYEIIRRYINAMGADGTALVGMMHRARPDEMHIVSAGAPAACKTKLVTWSQYACYPGDYD